MSQVALFYTTDRSNAFNSLNRIVALHNIQIACPSLSHILINTYRTSSRMIILGGAEMQSTEGTTQSNNLAMSFCAIATVQIQQLLRVSLSDMKQFWLASEAAGASSLKSLKNWWTNIISEGGRFRYYVNEKKWWLILKSEAHLETATNLFRDSKVNITTEGKRHLGASIDSNEFIVKYVIKNFNEWCEELKTLSNFAKSQSQAAYAAFCFGEQNKYSHFLRTIASISELMKAAEEIKQNNVLSSMNGESIAGNERQLYSLAAKIMRSRHSRFFQKSRKWFWKLRIYISASCSINIHARRNMA